MLDTYFTGDIRRISPEAPVPVFKKEKERSVLGGAANVAANLDAADQNVSVMSLMGNDDMGDEIMKRFERMGVNTDFCSDSTTDAPQSRLVFLPATVSRLSGWTLKTLHL